MTKLESVRRGNLKSLCHLIDFAREQFGSNELRGSVDYECDIYTLYIYIEDSRELIIKGVYEDVYLAALGWAGSLK
jgi:hypothetical protein